MQATASDAFQQLTITNPKRDSKNVSGRATWYPYYAGFSPTFARSFFDSLALNPGSKVMDPWNGSGTTIEAAAHAGHDAKGFDINPVMIVIARARMLSDSSRQSLEPLSAAIQQRGRDVKAPDLDRSDPLELWLAPEGAAAFRRVETGIQQLLIDSEGHRFLDSRATVRQLSDLAAFYYVALFRTARSLLQRFFTSNPTWVKKPAKLENRISPSLESVLGAFGREVESMAEVLQPEWTRSAGGQYTLAIASSEKLPLESRSIHVVLSSPPYCTRIDYAIATSVELAVLGIDAAHGLTDLRRAMIGGSVVPREAPSTQSNWGKTCLTFLDRVAGHRSKASATYYLKNHLQYFDGVFRSLREISRVLDDQGTCALVVQDSHYKDVHNDLPQIFVEMGDANDLRLGRQVDFENTRSMARMHPHARKYWHHLHAKESVLVFTRL
jgi:ubiquinone/menaquinone biosynthesis C-methylase UbiE